MPILKHPTENLPILAAPCLPWEELSHGSGFSRIKFSSTACKDPSSSLSLLLPLTAALLDVAALQYMENAVREFSSCFITWGFSLISCCGEQKSWCSGCEGDPQPVGGWKQSVLQHKPNLLLPLEISSPAAKALPVPACCKGEMCLFLTCAVGCRALHGCSQVMPGRIPLGIAQGNVRDLEKYFKGHVRHLKCWLHVGLLAARLWVWGCVILTVGLPSGSHLLVWLGFNLIILKGGKATEVKTVERKVKDIQPNTSGKG